MSTGDSTVVETRATMQNFPDDGDLQEPRESLITTAVSFLQNNKVRMSTLIQKQQFLRSKGLTATEIQLACERAGVFSQDPNNPNSSVINISTPLAVQQQQQLSPLGRLRELFQSAAVFSGVVYAIYMFWKKYIAPYLFGTPKRKPVDEALEDIEKKVDTRVAEVKELITSQQKEHMQQINREFNNFRSDLDAIKGLLLNRKQFASPLAAVTAPSIPAWQLASSPHHHHEHDTDTEKADDAGSGSGSSETEVVTKNSDSSLEIM